jgi:hypothetical protein
MHANHCPPHHVVVPATDIHVLWGCSQAAVACSAVMHSMRCAAACTHLLWISLKQLFVGLPECAPTGSTGHGKDSTAPSVHGQGSTHGSGCHVPWRASLSHPPTHPPTHPPPHIRTHATCTHTHTHTHRQAHPYARGCAMLAPPAGSCAGSMAPSWYHLHSTTAPAPTPQAGAQLATHFRADHGGDAGRQRVTVVWLHLQHWHQRLCQWLGK